ncbi:MAG: 4Fe-4S binding protein [Candidatus Bathyarchaeota archaeon]|nr:4Fe-4S binding protein [Candidatus Termiticorpusculum sp.]
MKQRSAGDKMASGLSSEAVKEYGLNAGASVVGIAVSKDFSSAPEGFKPTDVLAECLSVIVLGVSVPQEAILKDDSVGFIDVRNAINKEINDIAKDLEKWIKGQGYKSKVIAGMSGKWVERNGRKEQNGLISMKHAAELAGLGVIGRNYLLTNPKYGNLLWFSAVLTNADLIPDKKAEYNFCDNCNICVRACPSGALDNYPVSFGRKKCDTTMFKMVDKKWEIMCFLCRKMCPYRFGMDTQNT